MASATIQSSINCPTPPIRSYPTTFTATVTEGKGPTPGAIAVTTVGVDVDLSQLATYGFCELRNQASVGEVMVGIWNGTTFYPFKDLLPGENYVIRLSDHLGDEFETGTGTTGNGNTLRIKAKTVTCNVYVGVYSQ